MADTPLVSVIIPSFNSAAYVCEAIDSALAQTYAAVEIVLVDDGSTDGTRATVAKYDDRIVYLYQPNKGLPAARNTGIAAAKGQYLAFLDADDEWLPTKLETQVAVLRKDANLALVHSDLTFVDAATRRQFYQSRHREVFVGNCYERLFFGNQITPSTVVVRKGCVDAVGGFDEALRYGCEDWDLWLRLARSWPFDYVANPLTLYRIHEGNMSGNALNMETSVLDVSRKTLHQDPGLPAKAGRVLVRKRMATLEYRVGYSRLERGSIPEARRHFAAAIRQWPLSKEAWIALVAMSVSPATKAALRSSLAAVRKAVTRSASH